MGALDVLGVGEVISRATLAELEGFERWGLALAQGCPLATGFTRQVPFY